MGQDHEEKVQCPQDQTRSRQALEVNNLDLIVMVLTPDAYAPVG